MQKSEHSGPPLRAVQSLPSYRKITGLDWLKSSLIAFALILVVGGIAILSGRNKTRPVDWVHIKAINTKQDIALPDGSRIVLRKGSSVSYPSDFGIFQRIVKLKGEAYFEVHYDSSIPFSVKAINEVTTYKGTSFLIRSNDSLEQIFVSKGSLRFFNSRNKDEYVEVQAGQKAELVGNKIMLSRGGTENYLSWKNERLVFNHASLKQVADDIHDFYQVPVSIAPDINAQSILITAQFNNQPLTNILHTIGRNTGLVIENSRDSIRICRPAGVWYTNRTKPDFKDMELPPAVPKEEKSKSFWKFWEKKS